jgi:uncharacterized protein (TIGR03437 family)
VAASEPLSSMLDNFLTTSDNGVTGTYAGAGIGTWQTGASGFIKAQYPGMDQVNMPLPRTLAGRGELNIDLSIRGVRTNLVTIAVK